MITDRHRQTDRQTDRQTYRQTGLQNQPCSCRMHGWQQILLLQIALLLLHLFIGRCSESLRHT